MRAKLFGLVLVGAASNTAPLAQAQLLTHRDLSYAMAKTIAETAIDSCAAKGYAVSAVVSGSPGVDEPCVQAGLDKVTDQLK